MFETICKVLDALLRALGTVLSPVAAVLPDSPIVILIAFVVCTVLWIGMNCGEKRGEAFISGMDAELKFRLVWHVAAYLIGMFVALSGENHSITFSGEDMFVGADKMTWFNFMEWETFPQLCVLALVVGVLFLGLLYGLLRGPMDAVAVLLGLPTAYFAGHLLMTIRIWIIADLLDGIFLIPTLLNIAAAFPLEIVPIIMLPISFVVFLMPSSMISEFAAESRRRERADLRGSGSYASSARAAKPEPDYDFRVGYDFPQTIYSPRGELYRLQSSGSDVAEYYCSRTGDRVSFRESDFDEGMPGGWNRY